MPKKGTIKLIDANGDVVTQLQYTSKRHQDEIKISWRARYGVKKYESCTIDLEPYNEVTDKPEPEVQKDEVNWYTGKSEKVTKPFAGPGSRPGRKIGAVRASRYY